MKEMGMVKFFHMGQKEGTHALSSVFRRDSGGRPRRSSATLSVETPKSKPPNRRRLTVFKICILLYSSLLAFPLSSSLVLVHKNNNKYFPFCVNKIIELNGHNIVRLRRNLPIHYPSLLFLFFFFFYFLLLL